MCNKKAHIHDYLGPKWKWHSNDWGKKQHLLYTIAPTFNFQMHKNIFQLFFGKRSLNMISCAMSIFHVYLILHNSQNISTQFAFGASFTTLRKISANTLTCIIEAWHFMCGSVKLVSYEIIPKHHWGFYYVEQCIREMHKNRGTFKGIVEYQVALLFPLN